MEENVLRFDVPVDHIIVMHVLDCMADLFEDHFDFILSESPILLERGVQISREAELQYEIEMVFIAEE